MSTTEMVDVSTAEETRLIPAPRRQGSQLVRPIASTEDVAVAFQEYRRMSERILEDSDRIAIGERTFTKRSGWRKLATAYGVDLEVLPHNIHVDRDETGRILRATVFARAIAPNGRYADGVGVCDRYERCCATLEGCRLRHRDGGHCRSVEKPTCTRAHFSNYEHDLVATASTRAMNRAAADLFGLGEVSAEEITREESTPADRATPEQVAEITDKALATGSSLEKILESWGFASFAEMPYGHAVATIRRLDELLANQPPAEPVSTEEPKQEVPEFATEEQQTILITQTGRYNVDLGEMIARADVPNLEKLPYPIAEKWIRDFDHLDEQGGPTAAAQRKAEADARVAEQKTLGETVDAQGWATDAPAEAKS